MTRWPVFFVCVFGMAASNPVASPDTTSECQLQGEAQKVDVKGWPVTAAVQFTEIEEAVVQLQLSHHGRTQATLTMSRPLPHFSIGQSYQGGRLMMVKIRVEVQGSNSTLAALVIPEQWTSVRVNLHQRRLLVVVVTTGAHSSTTYTSKAQVQIKTHFSIDALSFSCPTACLVDVDLQCLQVSGEKTHLEHTGRKASSSQSGTPVWPFLVVVILLAVVIVLYLAWRYQHQQIKLRRQMQANAAKTRTSSRGVSSGSTRDSNSQEAGVKYSTVLLGYNGPYNGGDSSDGT